MIIQIDSREKAHAITKIIEEFDRRGIKHPSSKLLVGDYMNYDNPRLIIDRKQNLNELCQNVIHDHNRFRNELIRARDNDIKLIILIEHGEGITSLYDVLFWENPRLKKNPKATTGETLFKILSTMAEKYGVEYEFCEKSETGSRIIELLDISNG